MTGDALPTTLIEDRISDWWRPLAVDLDGERVARRRQGIETLRQALSREHAVDAVAYAHGDAAAGARIITIIRDAARPVDVAFRGEVADAEPPALVAAALAGQLAAEPDTALSTLISLLVLSASYSGLTPAIEGMRLSDYATRQLEHRSASLRAMADLRRRPSASELVGEALQVLEPTPENPWPGSGADRVRATHAEILAALAERIDDLAARAEAEHAVLREQLHAHTWVMESWCETAEAPWQEVASEARPMIAAVELAERTHGGTPMIDAAALLGSVLTAAGTGLGVDVDAAAAAAAPYLEGRLREPPHAALFPLTTALVRSREHATESDDLGELRGDRWSAPDWKDELEIAMQTYREVLALRALWHE